MAEAAVTAIYALHPQPAALCEAALRGLAADALSPAAAAGAAAASEEAGGCVSALALSHFFFVLGQVRQKACGP